MLVASDTISDFIFEINNLNYRGVNVHVASYRYFGGLWGPASLQMTSEVTSDFTFELSGRWGSMLFSFPYSIIHDKHGMLATASKQPQRLQTTSEMNSVASITYVNMLSYALNTSTA